jgi:hypothetical protein
LGGNIATSAPFFGQTGKYRVNSASIIPTLFIEQFDIPPASMIHFYLGSLRLHRRTRESRLYLMDAMK